MGECNCKGGDNSLLQKKDFKKYMLFLILTIIFGSFLIYKNCGK